MVGVGSEILDDVPADYQAANPNIQYWAGAEGNYSFQPISVPFGNNYPLQYGYYFFSVEMALCNALHDYYGTTIYVVKYGQGGATLAPNSETPYQYSIFLQQAQEAMNYLKNTLGKSVLTPLAFFSLGTNDSNESDVSFANSFAANAETFYTNLKTDLSLPRLRIGFGRVCANAVMIHRDIVKAQLESFVSQSDRRFYIDTDNYQLYSDNIHFTAAAYIQYGNDLYAAIKNYYHKLKPNPDNL